MPALKVVVILLVAVAAYAAAKSGSITVLNSGEHLKASFDVHYDLEGKNISEFSGSFTSGFNKTIQLPEEATNINLTVQTYLDMDLRHPGLWITVFNSSYPGPVEKCFELWGTPLNSSLAEQDC